MTYAPKTVSHQIADLELRRFVLGLCDLAEQLARKNGEPVQRPLNKHQIRRALDIHEQEREQLLSLLNERGYSNA